MRRFRKLFRTVNTSATGPCVIRKSSCWISIRGKRYFFAGDRPGLSRVIVPLPNFSVRLLDPSVRFVSVPLPNFCVVPVTVWPPLSRSVVLVPLPNFSVRMLDPSDRLVSVPLPNFCVVPVTVWPLLSRSVVLVPLPNFSVRLLDPSERFVSVPLPNFCVVPVRGLLGGSAANNPVEMRARTTKVETHDCAIVYSLTVCLFTQL